MAEQLLQAQVNAPALMEMLERNYRVILRQVDGLTHEDSLLQPPVRGNCLNWVLGHITQSCNRMLHAVGAPWVWTPEQIARYERNSEPVLGEGPGILRLEQIIADLGTMHERVALWLKSAAPADVDVIAPNVIQGADPQSIGDWLYFLLWHETYHVGQTEFLRQLAGKNDKII